MFFRKSPLDALAATLPITIVGARMGERLLQVGIDAPSLAGALAAKVGLSGAAAVAVDDEREAARAKEAAADSGVFVDVKVTPLGALPFAPESFDLVVVHAARGRLASMTPEARVAALQQVRRVLRGGGRVVVIESAPRGGLARLLRRHPVNEQYATHGGIEAALTAEGFRPVRVLAERGGYKFTEGLKTGEA